MTLTHLSHPMQSTLSIYFPTDPQDLLSNVLNECSPTALIAWPKPLQDTGREPDPSLQDIVVGCDDGSLYILRNRSRRRRYSSTSMRRSGSERSDLRPLSKYTRLLGVGNIPRSSSPSSTKSSTLSPMQLTRSRVVSGVSAERVEAPKNYVDFDDEPERLKGMLKGKGSREKAAKAPSALEEHLHADERSGIFDVSLPGTSSKILNEPRGVGSLRSPASSAASLSSPPSPSGFSVVANDDQSATWVPCLHIFPPWRSAGPITSLAYTGSAGLFLCLHKRG